MNALSSKWKTFRKQGIWEADPSPSAKAELWVASALRWCYAIAREFSEGGLNLHAMGLVYTTLLAMVPLLAVSFSVLKAFGAHNAIEPFLLEMVAPLGAQSEEIVARISSFLDNMKVGVLGFLGFVVLFYTVISLIQKIEETFNRIWRSEASRSFQRRFSDYLSVLLVGPVLVFSGLGMTASMASTTIVENLSAIQPFGTAFYVAGMILPYILICGAFTFLYKFIPTRRVHLSAALVGGLVAGIVWKAAGWAFAEFVGNSTKYGAIYSSFAVLVVFMIWVYVSWLILLMGAQVSFYYQYPQYTYMKRRAPQISIQIKERIGLLLMYHIGERFHRGTRPLSMEELVQMLRIPLEWAADTLQILKQKHLVLEVGEETLTYVPARDMAAISLQQIVQTVRTANEDQIVIKKEALANPKIDRILNELGEGYTRSLASVSLRDLLDYEAKPGDQRAMVRN